MKKKEDLVKAIQKELILRKEELNETLETIYFGGGTPSLLTEKELFAIFETIYKTYSVSSSVEITLEANPDDLSVEKIKELKNSPINRLSIGVQSFFEEDLRLMNRAHNAEEAVTSIKNAQEYFDNLSMDLIYGIPNMSVERWVENLEKTFALKVPHISCYALTVEPKTALNTFIEKGIVDPVDDALAKAHHDQLIALTDQKGYINYEFSNFGKPGYQSQNNLAYWLGKSYLGIGPSAHSFDGKTRSWNVSNNSKYLKALENSELPLERETLTTKDQYNEYVMTRLRTQWGVNLKEIETRFGKNYSTYCWQNAQQHINTGLLEVVLDSESFEPIGCKVTAKGKFLGDGIASDLFWVHLA